LSLDVAATTDIDTRARRRRGRPWLWLMGLILLAGPALAWLAARVLIVHSTVARGDAVAVLAGSSTYVERARHAANLFKEGRAPVIVLTNDGQLSGWSVTEQRNPFFFERAATELEQRGVPRQNIIVIPEPVSSTYDEALALRAYATRNNLHSLVVVSAPYQSRRALQTLRCVFDGTEVSVSVEAPTPGEQSPAPLTWWLHRTGWRDVPSEYLKLAYYYVRYC